MQYFIKEDLDAETEFNIGLKLYNYRTALNLEGISENDFTDTLHIYEELSQYYKERFNRDSEYSFVDVARILNESQVNVKL